MPTWPLIVESVMDSTKLNQFFDLFQEGLRTGVDGGRNTFHLQHLLQADRRDIVEATCRLFADSQGDEIARQLVGGGDYAMLLSACVYRAHEPHRRDTHLGLHFDANVFGQDALVFNFWIPFDRVGERAPGLTLVKSDVDVAPLVDAWRRSRLETADDGVTRPKIRFSVEEVAAALGCPADDMLFTPILGPGDALIFHQFVIHATQLVEQDEEPRRSFEIRICAADKIPHACAERAEALMIARRTANGGRELKFKQLA
ncbi:MAG: hypothetical protein HQ481_03120 [Alphaproteobacteria bacterium]|nr:hypothetical protein [Alphaproteobacteria bacterium]